MNLIYPQPTRFDVRISLFGIGLRVHPSFWIVHCSIPLLLCAVITNGFQDVLDSMLLQFYLMVVAVWIGSVFVSILIHEMAHAVSARLFGARDVSIIISAVFGMALGCSDLFDRWKRITVLAAGPAANFILAIVTFVVFLIGMDNMPFANFWLNYAMLIPCMLFAINVGLTAINSLPIAPLDGGLIANELRSGGQKPWEQDPDWWRRG